MANKYLIYTTEDITETPILFEQLLGHDDVARMIKSRYPDAVFISAGFWNINFSGDYKVYGESVSLGLSSRLTEDTFILNKCFNDGKLVIL